MTKMLRAVYFMLTPLHRFVPRRWLIPVQAYLRIQWYVLDRGDNLPITNMDFTYYTRTEGTACAT